MLKSFFKEKAYRNYIPETLLCKWDIYTHKKKFQKLTDEVLQYLETALKADPGNDELQEIHSFISEYGIAPIPYRFSTKYKLDDIKTYYDSKWQLPFAIWEEKKVYLRKGTDPLKVKKTMHALLVEQDPESPHRYLTPEFNINSGDVLIDIGAAEGNFTLSNIEKISKGILIEADSQWLKPLEATFTPWSEKIEVINKFASNKQSQEEINVDTLYREQGKINFIKIDVEGAEEKVINGAATCMREQADLKLAVCTYHKQEDATYLTNLLRQKKFDTSFSDRHMLFIYSSMLAAPYLRKGLIRATNNS